MNIESIIAVIASLVTILVAIKNDTPIFSLLKKTFFDTNQPQYFLWEVINLETTWAYVKKGFEPLTFIRKKTI